jgi:hypothetical protein
MTSTENKTAKIINKIITGVADCLKDIATKAVTDVIDKEVQQVKNKNRKTTANPQKKRSTPKRKKGKARGANENKNNAV